MAQVDLDFKGNDDGVSQRAEGGDAIFLRIFRQQDVLGKTRTKERRPKDEKIVFDINGRYSYRFLARSGL